MSKAKPTNWVQQVTIDTNSVEEANRLVSDAYKPLKIRPLTGNELDLQAQSIIVGGVGFTIASNHAGLCYSIEEPFDGYGLYVPGRGNCAFETQERQSTETDGRSGLVIDSSQVNQASFSPDCAWRGISIPTDQLHERIRDLTGVRVRGRLNFSPLIEQPSIVLNILMAFADSIFQGFEGDAPLRDSPAALASVINSTLCLLSEALPHDYSQLLQGTVAAPTPRQVMRAIDFMHANAKLPIQLKDVAEAAGVSSRSLQLSFKKFRGVSPMEYLRNVRLQGARGDLLSCPQNTRVATVAYRWGFAHMGIFAAQFRDSFGETPSETLRRSTFS